MKPSSGYDLIFVGLGLSAMAILWRLFEHPQFKKYNILILDDKLAQNDQRHICFWNTNFPHEWERFVRKDWDAISLINSVGTRNEYPLKNSYRLLNFQFFKSELIKRLNGCSNVHMKPVQVSEVHPDELSVQFGTSKRVQGSYIFDSRLRYDYSFIQQFKGAVVKSIKPAFNDKAACLMDFSESIQGGTVWFNYQLPLDRYTALIEATALTRQVLDWELFDRALKVQLNKYELNAVESREKGVIPMVLSKKQTHPSRYVPIGLGAGMQRATTGYLFNQIIDFSKHIAEAIRSGLLIEPFRFNARHQFYDRVFLKALKDIPEKVPGFFPQMFEQLKGDRMLQFMSGKSSLIDEVKLFRSLPVITFSKLAMDVARN